MKTYTTNQGSPPDSPGLSIGAVARATGVTVATLRAWEARFGFPTPRRLDSTHRRYDEQDVERIRRVVDARRAGYPLESAITQARAGSVPRSIYSAVKERWPELPTRSVSRATMLAISRAIEEECCARAARPVLVAAFQDPDAYAPARARWTELSQTAATTVVLAAFERTRQPAAEPIEVAISPRSPLAREWAVICDAPAASACVVGWEHPDRRGRAVRPYEALWSVDPRVVRTAARAALALAVEQAPGVRLPVLVGPAAGPLDPIEPDRLISLTERIIEHLDAAIERRT